MDLGEPDHLSVEEVPLTGRASRVPAGVSWWDPRAAW
jgi:hypothetical protein